MNKFLSFIIALVFLSGIIWGYLKISDGFSIKEMSSSLKVDPSREIAPLSEEKKGQLQKILSQKFRYLGKGCQFYVFEGEDQSHVIKFLKHKHLRPLTWLQEIPMPQNLRKYCFQKIAKRDARIKNLFSSCKLAYEEMPEETQILYLHLNKVPSFERSVVIVDKLGIHHQIEIDDYEFVIQKKARRVSDVFQELLDNGQEKLAREKTQQLIQLVLHRCQKGIRDRDRSFVQNVAFHPQDEKALFIDIGQFYKDETILEEKEQNKDLKKRLENLRYWTEANFPELTQYIDEEIQTQTTIN